MKQSTNNAIDKDQSKEISKETLVNQKKLRWFVLMLVLITVFISVVVLLSTRGEPEEVSITVIRAIGSQTARVTITEFADFGCISCKAWHQFGIREQVLERYGEQVRFVWRDFPVTTSQSPQAAEAGFCAHDQGQFWAYHDILFANAPALGEGDLKAYAAEIGLETKTFNACLDSGQHRSAVEWERTTALEQGFRSVPSFMVNDQRLIGPPSFDQLVSLIDDILASLE